MTVQVEAISLAAAIKKQRNDALDQAALLQAAVEALEAEVITLRGKLAEMEKKTEPGEG